MSINQKNQPQQHQQQIPTQNLLSKQLSSELKALQAKDQLDLNHVDFSHDDNLQNNQNNHPNKKTKKRKHHNRHKKHSPQYYRNLKKLKLNRKRQSLWDNRFHLEQLPIRQEKLFTKSTKKLTSIHKRDLNQNDGRYQDRKNYKTVNHHPQNQLHQKQKNKGFNVRVVNYNSTKKDTNNLTNFTSANNNNQQSHSLNKTSIREQLLNKILQTHTKINFPECQKQVMISMVKNCPQNKLNNNLQMKIKQQLDKIQKKQAKCQKICETIEQRQKMINGMDTLNDKQMDNTVNRYRQLTITIIEYILNWRQSAQELHQKLTKIKRKFQFYRNQQIDTHKNYLLNLGKDIKPIATKLTKSENIQQNQIDPFLLCYTKQKISKQDITKIRACELLLLEQHLKLQTNTNQNTTQSKKQQIRYKSNTIINQQTSSIQHKTKDTKINSNKQQICNKNQVNISQQKYINIQKQDNVSKQNNGDNQQANKNRDIGKIIKNKQQKQQIPTNTNNIQKDTENNNSLQQNNNTTS